MKMKNRTQRYRNLSSIKDLAMEKRHLQLQIAFQEKKLAHDWSTIRKAWDIVARLKNEIGPLSNALPLGVKIGKGIIHFLTRK